MLKAQSTGMLLSAHLISIDIEQCPGENEQKLQVSSLYGNP
jgi:hypothetical protein